MNGFRWLPRCVAAALFAAAGMAWSSAPAGLFKVPGCKAAQKLADGSWLMRSDTRFGRAGTVAAGSIILVGTVRNGLDLGSILEERCFGQFALEPDYPPYLWPPNGYAN